MPSTVVHVAFALLFAAALLGHHYDRRALAVVAAVAVVPDLDVFTSLMIESTHRAALHTILLPLALAVLTAWDTHYRERSWLQERYGMRGLRVAWVSLFGLIVSGIGLDLFTAQGVNLLYPLHDQFYGFTGRAGIATDGFFQGYIDFSPADPTSGSDGSSSSVNVDVGQRGSTQDVHVGSGVDPAKGQEASTVRRTFPIVYRGWHLLAVVSTGTVLYARARIEDTPV